MGVTHIVEAAGSWLAITRGLSIDPWRVLELAPSERPNLDTSGFQPVITLRDASGVIHKLDVPFLDRQIVEAFMQGLPATSAAAAPIAGPPATAISDASSAPPWAANVAAPAAPIPVSPPPPVANPFAPPPGFAPGPSVSSPTAPSLASSSSPLSPSSAAAPLLAAPILTPSEGAPAIARGHSRAMLLDDVTLGQLDTQAAAAIQAQRFAEAQTLLVRYAAGCSAGDRDGAEACVRAAGDLASKDVETAFYTLAIDQSYWLNSLDALWLALAAELDKKGDARAELARIYADSNARDDARVRLLARGKSLEDLEEPLATDSIRHFTLKASRAQSNARLQYDLARALIDDVEYEQALTPATQALSLDAHSVAYAITVAVCLAELERLPEAEGMLRGVIDSGTTDLRAHLQLANLYEGSSRESDALALLTSALEIAPRDSSIESAFSDLLEENQLPQALFPRLSKLLPELSDELATTLKEAMVLKNVTRESLAARNRDFGASPPPNRSADPWERPPDSTPRAITPRKNGSKQLATNENKVSPVVFGLALAMIAAILVRWYFTHR